MALCGSRRGVSTSGFVSAYRLVMHRRFRSAPAAARQRQPPVARRQVACYYLAQRFERGSKRAFSNCAIDLPRGASADYCPRQQRAAGAGRPAPRTPCQRALPPGGRAEERQVRDGLFAIPVEPRAHRSRGDASRSGGAGDPWAEFGVGDGQLFKKRFSQFFSFTGVPGTRVPTPKPNELGHPTFTA